jgi:hypothetical protein
MHFHWSNEAERRTDINGHTPKSWPYHGQAWLHLKERLSFSTEWDLWSKFCGLSFRLNQGEPELQIHAALPPVALWLTMETPWVYKLGKLLKLGYENREISLSLYEDTVRWTIWQDGHSWSSRTPWYRQGHINLPDFLFGSAKFERRILQREEVVVPLPEANYEAIVELNEATWKRPRWPFAKRRRGANVEIVKPLPTPGRGESDYDIGEDAIFSLSCRADTVAEAIGKAVTSALESRHRYGGRNWKPARSATSP